MVPRITTILQRFTGEWAVRLEAGAMLTVCRERAIPPGATEYSRRSPRPLMPVTDAARPHRLQSSVPPFRLAVPRGGLRSRPCQSPVALL